jgi:hypothetical protein
MDFVQNFDKLPQNTRLCTSRGEEKVIITAGILVLLSLKQKNAAVLNII